MTRFAGIVLAGGRSSRMGEPKALLDWFGTPLVVHVCELLRPELDGPLVVVRAAGHALPALPGAIVVEDEQDGRGPLEGIAAGLRAVGDQAEAVYVSATDVPLLVPAVVRLARSAMQDGVDAVVPRIGDRMYPLTAGVYRTSVLALVEGLLARNCLRALDLVGAIAVRWLSEAKLRTVDPELDSFRNVNTPGEYEAALARARAFRGGRRR